jgi:hypothetical protein
MSAIKKPMKTPTSAMRTDLTIVPKRISNEETSKELMEFLASMDANILEEKNQASTTTQGKIRASTPQLNDTSLDDTEKFCNISSISSSENIG